MHVRVFASVSRGGEPTVAGRAGICKGQQPSASLSQMPLLPLNASASEGRPGACGTRCRLRAAPPDPASSSRDHRDGRSVPRGARFDGTSVRRPPHRCRAQIPQLGRCCRRYPEPGRPSQDRLPDRPIRSPSWSTTARPIATSSHVASRYARARARIDSGRACPQHFIARSPKKAGFIRDSCCRRQLNTQRAISGPLLSKMRSTSSTTFSTSPM